MKCKAFVLLFLLGVAALGPIARAETVEDDDAQEVDASAFLLVRRKLANELPEVGKPNKVTVEIYNAGKGDAKSVSVQETAWNPNLFLTEGQLEAEYDTIPAGTSQSFTFTITPKSTVNRHVVPAVVATYVATESGKPITTKSAAVEVYVFSSTDILKSKLFKFGSTVTMGMLNTEGDWIRTLVIIAGGAAIYMLMGMYETLQKKNADRKRRSALKALGVAEDSKTK